MGLWRLALAWLVIASHTAGYWDVFSFDFGIVAVASFFFVSGYLMPLAFDANYGGASLRNRVGRFYVNRAIRIFPIYWVSLLAILAGKLLIEFGLLAGNPVRPPGSVTATYFQNFLLLGLNQSTLWGGYYRFNNPAWTLDVEIQYYLLAPLLVIGLARWRSATFALMLSLAAISVYRTAWPHPLVDIQLSLLGFAWYFFAGFALQRSEQLQAWARRGRPMFAIASVLLVAAWAARPARVVEFLLTLACMFISAHLVVLQRDRRFGTRDRLLGDLSYPTYILQLPVLALAIHYAALEWPSHPKIAFGINAVGNSLVTTLVAWVVWKIVNPFLEARRDRLKRAGAEMPAAAAEAPKHTPAALTA
jgi:peptidoglycan/LPS O-acetylase OafA/YrhL